MLAPADCSRYARAQDFLFGRINYERTPLDRVATEWKLDRMRELLDRLGSPDAPLRIVHVAGTKGKGSTSTMVQSALTAAGIRTGLYTSPHLDRVEERFAVDGEMCLSDELVDMVEQLRPVVEALDREYALKDRRGPTYFEITTAMAFLLFARRGAQAAVLEVGLGGRLDSTNVCRPDVTAITSISFDHTAQLGNTLASIAREKAGIIKPGVPCVSGVLQQEPRAVIETIASERGSRLVQLERDFFFQAAAPDSAALGQRLNFSYPRSAHGREFRDVRVGMLGAHQSRNAAVALAVLCELQTLGWQIPAAAIERGLAAARCPARVEIVSQRPLVIIDGAHNVASIRALIDTLDQAFPGRRRRLIFGASSDKDVPGMLRLVLTGFDEVIFTPYLLNPRALPAAELAAVAAEIRGRACRTADRPAEAWSQAQQGLAEDELICVAGSFFLAGELRREVLGTSAT